ncbi:hypothetical protein BUALT_Bualt13G0086900 [Buddleja alternifolia]|uniref:ACT domain-containing protein ACR n=1 Tax=Buddleja alternifolia TaxID=168488 RepID=A0AAV6WTI0_9LAMI|nr:hypothetical protein BUALT_Bualt13G0086900 [Buddleja alternifolia]
MCERLHAVLGESCIICELELAGPQYENLQGISSLSQLVAEELFRFVLSDKETLSQALSPDVKELKRASVKTDNSLSPAHTLIQINCIDNKGLLYDIMRTLKDCNIQDALCSSLKLELLHPLRVITNHGPDTELLAANPMELSRRGRPRIFYDVTCALKSLQIYIISAEIGRHSAEDREWEDTIIVAHPTNCAHVQLTPPHYNWYRPTATTVAHCHLMPNTSSTVVANKDSPRFKYDVVQGSCILVL